MRYSGRDFTEKELVWIRQLIADRPELSRKDLSVICCQKLGWLKVDGSLKDMSCRVAMLKMERDGHFILPPPRTKHTKSYKKLRTLWGIEQPEIKKKAGEFNLILELVDKRSSALWNEFIDRIPLPGLQNAARCTTEIFCQIRRHNSCSPWLWGGSMENSAS